MNVGDLTRREFLRLAGIGGVGLLAGSVAAGCSPSPVATPGAGVTPSLVPPTAKVERVLKVAYESFWGETLDPTTESGGAYMGLALMYDAPFEKDMTTGKFMPGIVDKWELASDHLSWTFHLRNDVVFHDGSKVTAEDIKFSYLHAARNEPNVVYGMKWREMLGDTPRIDVLDDYTVRIYTKGPQPDFFQSSGLENPYMLVFPKAYIEKNGLESFKKNPIASGPYQFVRYTPGDSMEFKAVGYKHWRDTPEFDRVITYLVPEETTRIAMLETGAVDVIPVSLEGGVKLKNQGFNTFTGEESCSQLWVHGAYHALAKDKPLADVRVRQALSLAINRQEIIDTMFHGFASMPAPPKIGWGRPDIGPEMEAKWKAWAAKAYRYDPDEAKRLLNDAGYGKGFTFDFWSTPDYATPYLEDLVITCASYWERLGIHANIKNVDKTAITAARNTGKSTDLVGKMSSDATTTRRPSSVRKFDDYTDKYGSKDYLRSSPDIKEFDALWEEGVSSFDAARIEKIVDRIIQISTDSWVGIPVVSAKQLYASGPRAKIVYSEVGQLASFYAKWKYTGVEKLPAK